MNFSSMRLISIALVSSLILPVNSSAAFTVGPREVKIGKEIYTLIEDSNNQGVVTKQIITGNGKYEISLDNNGDQLIDYWESRRGKTTVIAESPYRGHFTLLQINQQQKDGVLEMYFSLNSSRSKYTLNRTRFQPFTIMNRYRGVVTGNTCYSNYEKTYKTADEWRKWLGEIKNSTEDEKVAQLKCTLDKYESFIFTPSCLGTLSRDDIESMKLGMIEVALSLKTPDQESADHSSFLECLERNRLNTHKARIQAMFWDRIEQALNAMRANGIEPNLNDCNAFMPDENTRASIRISEPLVNCRRESGTRIGYYDPNDQQVTFLGNGERISKAHGQCSVQHGFAKTFFHEMLHASGMPNEEEDLVEDLEDCCGNARDPIGKNSASCQRVQKRVGQIEITKALKGAFSSQFKDYNGIVDYVEDRLGSRSTVALFDRYFADLEGTAEKALDIRNQCRVGRAENGRCDSICKYDCEQEYLNRLQKVTEKSFKQHCEEEVKRANKTVDLNCAELTANITKMLVIPNPFKKKEGVTSSAEEALISGAEKICDEDEPDFLGGAPNATNAHGKSPLEWAIWHLFVPPLRADGNSIQQGSGIVPSNLQSSADPNCKEDFAHLTNRVVSEAKGGGGNRSASTKTGKVEDPGLDRQDPSSEDRLKAINAATNASEHVPTGASKGSGQNPAPGQGGMPALAPIRVAELGSRKTGGIDGLSPVRNSSMVHDTASKIMASIGPDIAQARASYSGRSSGFKSVELDRESTRAVRGQAKSTSPAEPKRNVASEPSGPYTVPVSKKIEIPNLITPPARMVASVGGGVSGSTRSEQAMSAVKAGVGVKGSGGTAVSTLSGKSNMGASASASSSVQSRDSAGGDLPPPAVTVGTLSPSAVVRAQLGGPAHAGGPKGEDHHSTKSGRASGKKRTAAGQQLSGQATGHSTVPGDSEKSGRKLASDEGPLPAIKSYEDLGKWLTQPYEIVKLKLTSVELNTKAIQLGVQFIGADGVARGKQKKPLATYRYCESARALRLNGCAK